MKRIFLKIKQFAKTKLGLAIIGVIIVFLIVDLVVLANLNKKEAEPEVERARSVELISVQEVSNEENLLSIIGTVRSDNEAVLNTERSGRVIGVYRRAGNFVSAGTIIAEIENSSERASVLQAQGAVEQAEANLERLQVGTRDEQLSILEVSAIQAENNFLAAEEGARNTILSVYATLDDAIIRRADQVFSNPDSNQPTIILNTSDAELQTILQTDRLLVGDILERHTTNKESLSTIDPRAELDVLSEETLFIKTFLDTLVTALNKTIVTESLTSSLVSSYLTDVTVARSNVLSALSSITSAQDNLINKRTALSVAEENLKQGITGERSEDVRAAEASLKQARGSLAQAVAALEKTLIRTPISGTINTLSLNPGDFVDAFKPAAIVSSSGGFTIETFVTADEQERLGVGSKAVVDNRYNGVITSIAQGLDPQTKKVRVNVGIEDNNAKLIRGSSVELELIRKSVSTELGNEIRLPISSLKIETDKVIIFTVNSENELASHEVKIGSILGDKVIVNSGVTEEMIIVLDARGLVDGEKVVIE